MQQNELKYWLYLSKHNINSNSFCSQGVHTFALSYEYVLCVLTEINESFI